MLKVNNYYEWLKELKELYDTIYNSDLTKDKIFSTQQLVSFYVSQLTPEQVIEKLA